MIVDGPSGPWNGIAGVDEAGRGPLAGPVVASAVILCADGIEGLADSKQLSRKVRATLESQILAKCDVGIGIATPEEIDQINILQASLLAMHRAVENLESEPNHILVDGNRLPDWNYSSQAIVRGDALHPCVSAASIVAKESRDRMMRQAAKLHPHYAWESNMGYPTPAHISALRKHGATPLHRRTFGPVAQTILDF